MSITLVTELLSQYPVLTSVGFASSILFAGLTYKGETADSPMTLRNRLYSASCVFQLLFSSVLGLIGGLTGSSLVYFVFLLSSLPFAVFYLSLGKTKASDFKEGMKERKERMKRMQ
jgi:flagellar biosynthesis component FlhA